MDLKREIECESAEAVDQDSEKDDKRQDPSL